VTDQREVRVYAHSALFYWWPVWVTGYLMALLTYFDGHRLAIMPANTTIAKAADGKTYTLDPHGGTSQLLKDADAQGVADTVRLRVAQNSRLGAIFVIILLVVILITSAHLRGLWSVIVLVTVVLMSIILALADLWDTIFQSIGRLHIYINMAGYLMIATGLLVMWLAAFVVFDRQTYMIFTPGQMKVCLEIGGGETAYDTMGMTIKKERSDLFRHWILGLGSGDLIVRTSGANQHEFVMNNVLNVSWKLKQIQEMQRERPIVQG
jgi:hypothetical protein